MDRLWEWAGLESDILRFLSKNTKLGKGVHLSDYIQNGPLWVGHSTKRSERAAWIVACSCMLAEDIRPLAKSDVKFFSFKRIPKRMSLFSVHSGWHPAPSIYHFKD